MFEEIPVLHTVSQYFLLVVLGILAILFLLCLIRLILGPTVSDRLLAANMLGTMVISTIAILAFWLQEDYLLDIGLLYTLLSFLAVVVLAGIYSNIYISRQKKRKEEEHDRS